MTRSSERNIREFTKQAASFEAPGSFFGDTRILDWIAAHVAVGPDDRVLDVAGGTGRLGRHLGRAARLTVIADLTPAMLQAGAQAVREDGRSDVVFVEADARSLPFADGQFEVVASRFALHHIDDPGAALREMSRVCAPGGSVTVIDMVAQPGAAGERQDQLERLRDPSHAHCLREDELLELLSAAGLTVTTTSSMQRALPADRWLDQAQPSPAARREVSEALEAEAGGGPETGLNARSDEQAGLVIEHRYLLAGAARGSLDAEA